MGVTPSGFLSGGRGAGRRLPAFDGGLGAFERALGAAGRRLLASGVLVALLASEPGCDRRGGGGGLLTTGPCDGLEIGGPCEGAEVGGSCDGLDAGTAAASVGDGLSAAGFSVAGAEGGLDGRNEAEGATELLPPAGRGGLGLF